MTRIRYLTLLLALLCGTAAAQDFNPESPAAPREPSAENARAAA